ncbi:hypothetical protein Sps_04751 [Shewanella psychrophila]|uniref:FlxA-like protein n=1 Tax=Shewanella psychrophila TaxID=225848 RepID=A0A1S6HWM4_9GAMM|nr:hypothetical protein [Shewanella psychrophila]AQS39834.1 hypothetical protein Sps_04751 [Shewanella psychrophila]
MNINGLTLNIIAGKRPLDVQISTGSAPQVATSISSVPSDASSTQSSDKVSISEEGKEALSADKAQSGKATDTGNTLSSNMGSTLHGHHSESVKKAKEMEEEKAMSPIDKQIQRVKEQIEELQERLKELEGDSSEAAENERKLIQDQILALTGILVELIEKKARDAKSSSEPVNNFV